MSLSPSPIELRARALTDLRMGLPVVINLPTPLVICAAETITEERLVSLRSLGEVQAVVSRWRADTLKINVYDGDIARFSVPNTADAKWCHAVADPIMDMSYPLKGPFQGIRDGEIEGHRLAVELLKAAQLLPMAITVQTNQELSNLTRLPEEIILNTEFKHIVSAPLPLQLAQAGRLHVYRPHDGGDEHYAIEIGVADRTSPVLTRLHSACFTGDVLGSLKCDCGSQLNGALEQMAREGAGVLLYLNQEGRGIGLANKMRAYKLQDQGFDTVQANHRLGFEDDERDFKIGADLLKSLGFSSMRLMTNNPQKVLRLKDQGLKVVERVPLIVGQTDQNYHYLRTKAEKSGHLF
ncbi:GTP cyclohydrolase II [Planktomarina sp.]|nr:GTP cyclohydrolase II [Planktomarina sp.]MDA9099652.1 GTP cyclohydrolase II [Planktomarina sp.]